MSISTRAQRSLLCLPFAYSLLLGAAMVATFAPLSGWYLQPFLLAAWLYQLTQSRTQRHAVTHGYLFGLGFFGLGLHWLTHSMSLYGGMPYVLTLLALLLAASVLAIMPIVFSALYWRLRLDPSWRNWLLLSLIWSLLEAIRGYALGGFPWLALGYAHSNAPLAGFAAWLGVYGTSGLALLLGLLLLRTYQQRQTVTKFLAPLTTLVLLLLLGMLLPALRFTSPVAAPLAISLVQPNIAQESKFTLTAIQSALDITATQVRASRGQLIILPETVLPLLPQNIPNSWFAALALDNRTLLFGALTQDEKSFRNSVLAYQQGRVSYQYDKHHLVPFGEFVPWGFQWFVDAMKIPLGSLSPGQPVQTPLEISGVRLAFAICYENVFGAELARHAQDAHLVVNVSNLAWFGVGNRFVDALAQHAQMSQWRTLELQKPLIASTNNGLSLAYDHRGRLQGQLPRAQAAQATFEMQGYAGTTPYAYWRDLYLLLALAYCVWYYFWRRKQTPPR